MISNGIDVFKRQQFKALHGKRVGLIVNPTSVDANFVHLIDLLHADKRLTLSAILGPEHGVRGEAQYMVAVDDVARDSKTGVPVYSLYGHTYESLTPRAEWLKALDVMVFDIQDVGSRYYTYIYTMALAMKAAAKQNLEFIVLDRPNPLGLTQLEGNIVGEKYRSFVGLYPLATRHGMTAGEIARWVNETEKLNCALTVISCEGLKRTHSWADTGLPFISPSPNMPTPDTALVYPGMCLGEGTNISEGRGTCRPFEQFGAPFLKSGEVADALNSLQLPGVRFRPCAFTPTFDKFKGVSCEGAFIHVTDPRIFKPLLTGVAVFKVCRELAGASFAWRADAYEFVEDVPAFDLLCGTDAVRLGYEGGKKLSEISPAVDAITEAFQQSRNRAMLYD